MRYLLLLPLLGLLMACSSSATHDSVVAVGMPWSEAKAILLKHEWKDTMAAFELEGDFARKDGQMYQWENFSENTLEFSTLPKHGVETLHAIHPTGSKVMGGEINILSISAE